MSNEAIRANGKVLLSHKEAADVINYVFDIKPRRTPAQRAQRDEFLKAARLAQSWLNNIVRNAEKDNWSEVEFFLENGRYDYEKMKALLPTDRAEPQGN
ncbi:TPA: hypothetical protein I8Y21_004436 [Klebsiella oxytoca]|uniref:Uncharacterized protein n=1 Tax=Klebsiella oxytoca TaxID=571 RepID=A0AAN5LB38_KLEOX|nr:hypothetical protein [Klebsiella oxytoca]